MSYYIFNTNAKTNERFTDEMLAEQKVSCYTGSWRGRINRLCKDDIVFLYKNGTGIVAYGIADGERKMKDCDNKKDEEYYMYLNSFEVLHPPMSLTKMRELSNKWLVFRSMLFSVDVETGERFIKEIEENHLSGKHN